MRCAAAADRLDQRLLLLCLALMLALAAGGPRLREAGAQAEATVRYAAGWNIVSTPTGTSLGKSIGEAYAFGPGATTYDLLGPGELVAGRAAWVYFPQDTTITLGKSAAEYSRIVVAADQFVLAGNPSSSEAVAVSGADMAFVYDPGQGLYKQVTELQPGQGAFMMSHAGGAITLGKAPGGAATEEVTRLQAALTANPFDRPTVDELSAQAAELVRNRQYAQVQTVLDDARAADDDGFRLKGSGPAGPLDKAQLDSEVRLREAVAQAKTAAASNNLAGADAAMDAARKAAQDGVDAAVAEARANGTSAFAYAQARASGLAAGRALFRVGLPFAGTGQLLTDTFYAIANAKINSTPLPAGPAPAAPTTTRFFGNVTINGQPASGSSVTALVNNVNCGSGPIDNSGRYSLAIATDAACNIGGSPVSFSIGGAPTDQQGTIPPGKGASVQQDLTISSQRSLAPSQPSQPASVSLPFVDAPRLSSNCTGPQPILQFLSATENPPGVINASINGQLNGQAPGSPVSVYLGPSDATFVSLARKVAGGVVDNTGFVGAAITVNFPHPQGISVEIFEVQFIVGGSCSEGTVAVSFQQSQPVCPQTSLPGFITSPTAANSFGNCPTQPSCQTTVATSLCNNPNPTTCPPSTPTSLCNNPNPCPTSRTTEAFIYTSTDTPVANCP